MPVPDERTTSSTFVDRAVTFAGQSVFAALGELWAFDGTHRKNLGVPLFDTTLTYVFVTDPLVVANDTEGRLLVVDAKGETLMTTDLVTWQCVGQAPPDVPLAYGATRACDAVPIDGYAPSMRVATALGALLFIACSKKEPPADESAGSQTFSLPVKPLHVAFAHFEKDHVVECSDVTTTSSLDEVEQTFADERKISQPCAAAFASRVTLAVCTVGLHTDAGASMMLSVAHYDFAAVALSDKSKSDCLSKGGNWNPLKRESTAFQRAKLEYEQRNARDAAD